MAHIAIHAQTDYVRAQYAAPHRVVGLPDGHVSRLSDVADRYLRETTGRGLYQHGFNEFKEFHGERWLLHTKALRFALHQ